MSEDDKKKKLFGDLQLKEENKLASVAGRAMIEKGGHWDSADWELHKAQQQKEQTDKTGQADADKLEVG